MENDVVNHPAHYTSGFSSKAVECIDITRGLSFSLGNAFKYVWRAGKKGSVAKAREDLDKARWYLRDVAEFGLESGPDIEGSRRIFGLVVPDGVRHHILKSILQLDLSAAEVGIDQLEFELTGQHSGGGFGI